MLHAAATTASSSENNSHGFGPSSAARTLSSKANRTVTTAAPTVPVTTPTARPPYAVQAYSDSRNTSTDGITRNRPVTAAWTAKAAHTTPCETSGRVRRSTSAAWATKAAATSATARGPDTDSAATTADRPASGTPTTTANSASVRMPLSVTGQRPQSAQAGRVSRW